MANYLAMAALVEPGDEVWIEHPAYEPILALAEYLRARIKRWKRRPENRYRLEPDEIKGRPKMAVVTNLHNPTSVLADEDSLRALARRCDWLLVDEVYREAVFDRETRSAFHLAENIVITNSLTKVYGLSGLRSGWVLAPATLADKMRRLNDLFGVNPPYLADQIAIRAFAKLPELAERLKARLSINRAVLFHFFDQQPRLEDVRSPHGTVVFPRLDGGSVDELCSLLRSKYDTTVVPGHFFEMPQHLRIGITGDPADFAEGLTRLGAAIKEMHR
jgi:aspartate/methionine/tyrosine aminotransferase